MLKTAFNALTRLHSRPALLKRLGTVDIYTPVRITPSNYFRFLRGPEYTTIPGKEFIIPADSMIGQFAQKLVFELAPTTGAFKIKYGTNTTGSLAYDATAAQIQTALSGLTGLSNVTVSGSFVAGFLITFRGFQTAPELGQITDSTLDKPGVFSNTNVLWTGEPITKGDRILDGTRLYSVDEIMEMPDMGGKTMGFRCRCD